ncbi:MAG: GNAT family N-acetyltransferase [Ruminiclostridium sp.]|nr:GNAT family N-acetyltransferase [Ruminiclostridium sp.]
MELTVKHFNELTAAELFDIYKLRTAVFVVEQNCAYQEVDDADKSAYHVWLHENGEILAYIRVLPKGIKFDDVSIGRVISAKRRQGFGTRILNEGIKVAKEKLGADIITIEAQTYAKGFYENAGFVRISEEFLEDGIPHIRMRLDI